MSYLFEGSIEAALDGEKRITAQHYKQTFQSTTTSLLQSHRRVSDRSDDLDVANGLVQSMGTKTRGTGPHAMDFVDQWRMVSDNCGTIRQMVSSELNHAYGLGLDVRDPQVIGTMFDQAVLVWSELGAYTGYAQDEGRR